MNILIFMSKSAAASKEFNVHLLMQMFLQL